MPTHQLSAENTLETAAGPAKLDPASDGLVHFAYFKHTQVGAGAIGSTVALRKMPAGRVRILGTMSRVNNSAFGASRTLGVGHTGYQGVDGVAVAAAASLLLSAGDVAAAGGLPLVGFPVIESMAGFTLLATVAGGTIPDAATLEGVIAYTVG